MYLFHTFQFDQYKFVHYQIRTKCFLNHDFFVSQGNRCLHANVKSTFPKLIGQHSFISRFKQSRTKYLVYLDGAVYNCARYVIFRQLGIHA